MDPVKLLTSISSIARIISRNSNVGVSYGDTPTQGSSTLIIPKPNDDASLKELRALNGFLDQEAAYVRFKTPIKRTIFKSKFHENLTGILDGVRVNYAMGKVYKGCKENFDYMNNQLIANTYYDGEPPENQLALSLWAAAMGITDERVLPATSLPIIEQVRKELTPSKRHAPQSTSPTFLVKSS